MRPHLRTPLRVTRLFLSYLIVLAVTARMGAAVVINEIHYHPKDRTSPSEFIELFNTGPAEALLSGWEFSDGVKFSFPEGTKIAAAGYLVVAKNPAGFKAAFGKDALGPWKGKLKNSGEALILVDAKKTVIDKVKFDTGFPWPTAADGEGASLELLNPAMDHLAGSSWRSSGFVPGKTEVGSPTPGEKNSTAVDVAPPSISAIGHAPPQPKAGEAVRVAARVVAPGGVKTVTLLYQVVEPGKYVRKTDEAFEKDWTPLPMRDDGKDGDPKAGDSVYSAVLPAAIQVHRRLIRYRISAEDAKAQSVRVPYADDACPNFTYFCSNGAPAWTGFPGKPGEGQPLVFPAPLFTTLPTVTLVGVQDDVEKSQWNGGANKKEFTGALIADGKVYDHIEFSNRGQGSTNVCGKNKWGFKFNPTREFEIPEKPGDKKPRTSNSLSMNACASPWVQTNRGMAGLDEALSFRAYEIAGVPSSQCRYVQFRVIDGAEEMPKDQYTGDLWGLYMLVEDPDGSFLNERDLSDGNIYRMAGGGDKKHQAAKQPKDKSDLESFMGKVRGGADENWWRANLDLPAYYSFHAISRLVGNVDLRENENHFLYHAPDNRWVVMPWDLDMMFIPKSHQSGRVDQARCLDVPALRNEYRNRCREILDLFCDDPNPRGGQFAQLLDEYVTILRPPGQRLAWPELDQCLWNHHPRTADKGAFYRNPVRGGPDNNWDRKLATSDFAGFVKFIFDFVSNTRPANTPWKLDDGIPAGYGYGYLLADSESADIPDRPKISYTGLPTYAANALAFTTSAFSSKKTQFAAVQWRLARIAAPGIPGYEAGNRRRYELDPEWTSADLAPFNAALRLPINLTKPGDTYRARVRMKDNAGRYSRWSEPIQFTATPPAGAPVKPGT